MPVASLKALDSLRNLYPTDNAFFDPTGADSERRRNQADLSDELEIQTGLNPTARHELGLASLQALLAEAGGRQRQADRVGTDEMYQAPGGDTFSVPAELKDRLMGARLGMLEGEAAPGRMANNALRNFPTTAKLGDLESEAAAGREFLPEASAVHARGQQDIMAKLREQFQIPAEMRAATAEDVARTRAQGQVGAAQARQTTAEDRAAKILGDFIKAGTTDERTHKTRPYKPEEIQAIRSQYDNGGVPGGPAGALAPELEQAVTTALQLGRFHTRDEAIADLRARGYLK